LKSLLEKGIMVEMNVVRMGVEVKIGGVVRGFCGEGL
jgi:hypothetical protein